MGKMLVLSFKDEEGRANEVGFLVLPADQRPWMDALRKEILSAGGKLVGPGRLFFIFYSS